MSWITPFVNWITDTAPLPSAFNRIEGNIQYLKDRGDTDRILALTGDVSGSTTYDDNGGMTVVTTVADNSHSHVSSNISDATSLNTANMIIRRDSAGNFSAGTITATLNGNAATATYAGNAGSAETAQSSVTAVNAQNATTATTSSLSLASNSAYRVDIVEVTALPSITTVGNGTFWYDKTTAILWVAIRTVSIDLYIRLN